MILKRKKELNKTGVLDPENTGASPWKMVRRILFWLFNTICFAFIVYQTILYFQDRNAVKTYLGHLRETGVINAQYAPYENALKLRDHLLKVINPKSDTCKFFSHSTRPLWGYRTSTIIKYKEGQCGEVARLLLNLFSFLDLPSRKVYLYTCGRIHAALEIHDGLKWIVLDTIEAPANFREYTVKEAKAITDYFQEGLRGVVSPKEGIRTFGFINYSYFNWNKLLNNWIFGKLGFSVYTHRPVLDRLQIILENPPLLFALLVLFLQVLVNLILFTFKWIYAYCRKD